MDTLKVTVGVALVLFAAWVGSGLGLGMESVEPFLFLMILVMLATIGGVGAFEVAMGLKD